MHLKFIKVSGPQIFKLNSAVGCDVKGSVAEGLNKTWTYSRILKQKVDIHNNS